MGVCVFFDSSSHQAEHHHQVEPGSVCQQVRPAHLVRDKRAGADRRVSVSLCTIPRGMNPASKNALKPINKV